jgi:LCP family protein required for cell wall assembly
MSAPPTISTQRPRRGALVTLCIVTLMVLIVQTRCSRDSEDETRASSTFEEALGLAAPELSSEFDTTTQAQDRTGHRDNLVRLLLVGFDRAHGEMGRTDAILVVVMDRSTGQVGVISVPRDLWVDIPGHEPGRINSVVRIGERLKGPGEGIALLEQVLDEQLGLPVIGTIGVSLDGFTEIIDALGGVDVDVRCPIEDNFISPHMEGGYERLSLDAGPQRLDGSTALLYTRSRHGRSDTDRSYRQQAVLLGVKKKVLRTGALPRLPRLWRILANKAMTDLDFQQALSLATLAASANTRDIHGLVLASPVVTESRSWDGKWILLLDRDKLDNAVDQLFDSPLPGSRPRTPCPPADVALHWKKSSSAP